MKDVKWRNLNSHKKEVERALEGQNTIIVFDTETTGLEDDAKIIQFSAVKYAMDENRNLKELETMDMLINPEMAIDSTIEELTGITNNMLMDKEPESAVYKKIFDFMATADVWAGQNVGFDIKKLRGMAKRQHHIIEVPMTVDTLAMARNLMFVDDPKLIECAKETETGDGRRGNHKLATITKYLFPDYQAKYHNSLEDVRATAKCLGGLLKLYEEAPPELPNQKRTNVNYAYFWVNPNKRSDQRIRVSLNDGSKTGSIYYDALNHYWSCTSSKEDKEHFDTTDKCHMENQVLSKYFTKYGALCMEDLVRKMRAEYQEKQKKNESQKNYQGTQQNQTPGQTSIFSQEPARQPKAYYQVDNADAPTENNNNTTPAEDIPELW